MKKHIFRTILILWVCSFFQPVVFGIELVSVSSTGVQANKASYFSSISGDGRFVAFSSDADNLVNGDTNNSTDIFLYDLTTKITQLISVDSNGIQGNDKSYSPFISDDGRYVAFTSNASNLAIADGKPGFDIFVYDRSTQKTQLVSISSTKEQANKDSYELSISGNGRFVVFSSDADNLVPGDTKDSPDIFVHDRIIGLTQRVTVNAVGIGANDFSDSPSISDDGRFIAFRSEADNLVADDTNGTSDNFVHDRITGKTQRVSVSSVGNQANGYSYFPAISGDGKSVAFSSWADNIVVGDTNDSRDIFVHDLSTGVTERVSVSSTGKQGNSSSIAPSISDNHQFVAFTSHASNLVIGDIKANDDVFIHNRISKNTDRVSVSSSGAVGNQNSGSSSISSDGRLVTFDSRSDNLVDGDTNNRRDVFIAEFNRKNGNPRHYFADINPHHCPNLISTGVSNTQTVSIMLAGKPNISIWKIKAHTIRLENTFSPVSYYRRDKILDHKRQNMNDPDECFVSGVDGRKDLILKFSKADVLNAMRAKLGRKLRVNDTVELNLTGMLSNGRLIKASDFIRVRVIVK